MKILYIKHHMHDKNHHALINYKTINLYVIDNIGTLDSIDLSMFDCVYSPCIPIDVNKYPNTKFLFGPHFSVFPEKQQMDIIRRNKVLYAQPSEWAAKIWQDNELCKNIKVESLPFGVDIEKFKDTKPKSERTKVVIYFKRRHPNELRFVTDFLSAKNIEYRIFNYLERYNENEYLNYLQNSKFCFWLDAHESQGFALEEALSCDVPLIVWNIKTMKQEHGSSYTDIPATTIPYWDERCGEYFYDANELENVYDLFISKLETYKPREYIVENLSIQKCEEKFVNLINSF